MMDGLVQPRDRERSLYASPSFPRAPSRSSTSTSATRRTSQSANSSSSRLVSSPRPASSHPSHRFHHTSCAQSTVTSRPASIASRDRGSESGRQSAASSYLQEKLQKRREEAERQAAARATQTASASMELPSRHVQSSPVKGGSADGHRPRSAAGNGETPKKGMGLKEMEDTVSTLHKQNFDLKLELFHRRERQNVLEERIDAIEAEKSQIDEVNDKLLDELEKRDKAVQEAVQMIVALEAQVEKLAREREMIRQVTAGGPLELDQREGSLNGPTPKSRTADLARLEADAKALNRMPSFMSDRAEDTEHLRKVYLNSRGSVISLRKGAAEGTEEDSRRVNSLTSPSLSVLSEGSFASIYGDKEDEDRTFVADVDGSPRVDGASPSPPRKLSSSSRPVSQRPASTMPARLGHSGRSASVTRTPGPGQFQSIHDIIDHTSPLQKIARLDPAYYDQSPTQGHFPTVSRGQSYQHVKGAKRETLRRVTTDGPPTRSGDQALPPTPDTISTSTLRRFKNSDDMLPQQRDVSGQRSYQSVSEGTSRADDVEHGGAPVFHQPLVSGFGNEPISVSHFDARPPLIARPRSADEGIVSRRGEIDWESDADSVHSLDSSLDIWLQQGKDPKALGQDRSESPDLFNFPPSLGGGWTTHPTFEPPVAAFQVPSSVRASNHAEDLLLAQEALFPGAVQPPPAPYRRSSLGAKTGPTSSRRQSVNGKLRKSPSRSGSRRNSVAESVASTPQQPEPKSAACSKVNHYPPSSGTPRGHRLNFFRRSIGGGSVASPPEPAHPPVATEQAPAGAKLGSMGVPSWVQHSNGIDDDRASATPPPIMRNPRHPRAISVDEGAPIDDRSPASPVTPMAYHATPTPAARGSASGETTPTGNSANGGASLNKRKWLPGFGRTSSLRNRAG
ncbi:hypothetical protein CSOJ01_10163 [Colletotrichum sojae]|uniref:Centrosomin N-terminal motif 1 domain-containing protein n=1 Tax=Colletotrichum sojae TaxID=2175907 RepID=A0A8H6J1N5_9PEZI|nr:hypothetical protein CSOJ01_10163 [Colletotrichum sojae]